MSGYTQKKHCLYIVALHTYDRDKLLTANLRKLFQITDSECVLFSLK